MPSIKEAVRVVGYLLENNQTSQAFARDSEGKSLSNPLSPDACQFCLSGAVALVSWHILKDSPYCRLENCPLYTAVQDALGIPRYDFLCEHWDDAIKKKRYEMVKTLKAV